MEWGLYVNLAHIQMLTDPFTPMGCSLFRAVTHLSEKYLLYLNGFVFINIAGFTNNWLLRRITISAASRAGSCIERFGTTVDAEMAQIVKEVHKNHYPFFDHTQAAQAFRGIKQEFVKPLVKRVLGYARRRASVAEMEQELLRLMEDMGSVADALAVAFPFFEFNVRMKAIVNYIYRGMTKITAILAKNGMKGEEDQLWPLVEGNLAKQMNDSMIRLGRGVRELKKEEEVKVGVVI